MKDICHRSALAEAPASAKATARQVGETSSAQTDTDRTKRRLKKGTMEMHMSAIFETVGTAGSLMICASALPQVVKTYRTKRSRDLSIAYLGVLISGMGLLQAYSIYVKDFVFILGNSISMISTGLLIVLWFKYGGQRGPILEEEERS